MKRAAEKERSKSRGSKRCRFAGGYEELPFPTEIDAQSYLISAKEHLKDDTEKFAEFIQIFNDFRSNTCDTIGVFPRLKKLVKNHELLLSFNKFLPKGLQILFPSKKILRNELRVQLKEALRYIQKIKTRFQNEEYIRKGFFEIFNAYMKGNKSVDDIHAEVKLLFCDHQDLVDEFAYLLPASTGSALVPNLKDSAMLFSEPAHILTSVKDSQKEDMGKQGQKYFTLNSNCLQISQFSLKKDAEGTSDAVVNEHSKKDEKEKEFKEGWQWKDEEMGENRPAQNMESELYVMDQDSHGRNLVISSDDLYVRQRQMDPTDDSPSKNSQQGPPTDPSKTISGNNLQQLDFFEKVKRNIGEVAYQQIVKCINVYNRKIINSKHLQHLGVCILGKCPEVVNEFNEIISQSRNEIAVPSVRDGHKDQHHKSRAVSTSNAFPASNNEKITYKPISEMDVSHLEQCTPRYRLLPQNFVKPIASCSTGLDAEVLNDICVSVASGTEDYRKKRQLNPYEEAILNCEDDRFELDMLIKNSEAAIERVHELLEKQHDNTTQTSVHLRIEDHLTAMNLRCIELIYGNCGLRIIDLLLERPDRCLPVIVKRLKQKHDEWVNCRTRFNKGWADVYTKYYQRSLDLHSSCFNQREAKCLSQKRRRTHFHL